MDNPETGQDEVRRSDDATPTAGGIIDDRIVEIMVYLHEVLPD